ncbi:Uncharacterised protein [Porphyromonas crevioricanis]|uniref:Uncharacterized protein n=2 Tax=Porphyromonas crevioricanis TaxID=393921 RepID=A0A2X4PXB5_9PORP|nr:hypothetical protein SAMN02745203_01608 [Porphyromonas crevioricanis]SQH72497.1 Uncharacterised protein [Porphyromonas crevioricanis]
MLSPVLAKFLSGEKIDPLRTAYSSAFQKIDIERIKREVIRLFVQSFLLSFSTFCRE